MRHALAAITLPLFAGACGDPLADCPDGATLTALVVQGGSPVPEATVYLLTPDGDTLDATTGTDGRATFDDLEPGAYTVAATTTDGGADTASIGGTTCSSPDLAVTIDTCDPEPVSLSVDDCITADKPNLYLYPTTDTPVAVRLHLRPQQRVVAADPAYPRDGWRGIAHPDGTITVHGQRAPFLFYEVSLTGAQVARFQRHTGWCLPEDGAVDAMAAILEAYGFTAREVDDFVDGWHHDLPPSPSGYAVYPQTQVDFAAGVQLSQPLPLHRLWLLVDDGAACTALRAPAIQSFPRHGAHAVEWGLVRDGLVP